MSQITVVLCDICNGDMSDWVGWQIQPQSCTEKIGRFDVCSPDCIAEAAGRIKAEVSK